MVQKLSAEKKTSVSASCGSRAKEGASGGP